MKGADKHFYRFKSFRLDVEERQLLHHNLPVSLTPKAFDVLALLVERNGHLVGKDELMQTIWADSFVEEQNITRTIHTLRKTLGEDENGNKFIETVATKGYRFVAKVTEMSEPLAGALDLSEPPAVADGFPVNQKTSLSTSEPPATAGGSDLILKTRIILFAVGFLSAVFLILLLSFNFQTTPSVNPNNVKSIAVLPLKPINAANRDEIYEIGIADSLIHRLGSMKGFVIRPLGATRQYADLNQDPLAAGREQRTDYVLASNYQIADGKIRITAQLFNVASGQIEETYKSEKDFTNIFAMQDAIAGEVGDLLQTRFVTTSSSPTAKRGTNNEEAYRLYLQGKYIFENGANFEAIKAVEAFGQAVRLAPNYAQAWASKATAHQFFANFGRNTNIQEHNQKSLEAINKALALDENSAEAHVALCGYKLNYEWDFDGAERECRRAIELDPDSASAHQVYAGYLSSRGRFDELIAEMKISKDLEPASLIREAMDGIYLDYARRYTEAVAQYKRVIAMNEDFGPAYPFLYHALSLQGKYDEAFEWFLKLPKFRNEDADKEYLQSLRKIYKESGWQGIKQVQVKDMEESNAAYYLVADSVAEIGNKDRAFEYLEKAFERREPRLVYLKVDPRFDALHDDPRFDELVRRVGLK